MKRYFLPYFDALKSVMDRSDLEAWHDFFFRLDQQHRAGLPGKTRWLSLEDQLKIWLPEKASALMQQWLNVFLTQRPSDDLAGVAASWENYLHTAYGIRYADVYATRALNDAEKTRIQKRLHHTFGTLSLRWHIHPELIAGLRFQVGDWCLDQSIQHQLQRLHLLIIDAIRERT